MMRRLRMAGAASALLVLTACGSGSPAGGGGGATSPTGGAASTETQATGGGELTAIEVGVIPIVDVAPIYLGVEEGIFEKHGLDVTLTLAQGGAAIVPAVQNGQMDFDFSNVTSLVIGKSRGLPLQLVAAGNPEKILCVEMPFPDMAGQLAAGHVDAIGAVEPFVTISEEGGARPVFAQYAEPIPDLSVAGYFTTDSKVEQEPELVDAFVAAMKESQQYATDHPDEAKAILPTYTSLTPDVIENLTMPRFPQEHDRESLQKVIDLSLENGLINQEVALEDLAHEGA